MILIYGTASSGKSNIAENMTVSIARESGTELIYIATMENESEAAKKRIRAHRAMREGKGFYTIEEMYKLSIHELSVLNKTVLIECMSNLCANIYFKKYEGRVACDEELFLIAREIVDSVKVLMKTAHYITIVTNDIFSDGTVYDEWTESYMKLLARVNSELVKICDDFYEVVNGVIVKHK